MGSFLPFQPATTGTKFGYMAYNEVEGLFFETVGYALDDVVEHHNAL